MLVSSCSSPALKPTSVLLRAVAALLTLIFAAVPVGAPAPALAQEYHDEAERWAYKLIEASHRGSRERGEPPIDDFRGVIRVPPTWSYLFEGAVVDRARADRAGDGYEIDLELPDGGLILLGTRGRAEYDQALAAMPRGCTTSQGRARGYCFRDGPYYEYFPDLLVGEHSAVATFGSFETNFGGSVILEWYDQAADITYTLRMTDPEGLVARAGFQQWDGNRRNPRRNAEAARRLGNTVSRFLGVDLSRYPG